MKVQVHRNVSPQYKDKECVWSVRAKVDGKWKVVDHVDGVVLRDVKFHVGKSGQAEVRRSGQKNVHAWAEGELVRKIPQGSLPKLPGHEKCRAKPVLPSGAVRVDYNPHTMDTFIRADCDKEIREAKDIVVGPGGLYALSPPPCSKGVKGLSGVPLARRRCNGSDWNG